MANYPELQLYINGQWKSADGQPVINPSDESELGVVPHATKDDLNAALAAAKEGFRVWRNTAPAKRAEILFKATQIIRKRSEEMAVAMSLEQGKPIKQSRAEVAVISAKCLPTGIEPVKVTKRTSGCGIRYSETSDGTPNTRLRTPGGKPAS